MEAIETNNASYRNDFDGRRYLDIYYALDPETLQVDKESQLVLTFLHNEFSLDGIKGESVIEIGAGPSLWHILSACEKFEKIYLTDYSQTNLSEIKKWLEGDNDAFDWTPYLKYVCELEGTRSTPEEKAAKIKRKVTLLQSDVTFDNPLHPVALPLADCVIIASCLLCICKNYEEFTASLKKTVSLIKPGGHLIMSDYLHASYYLVDNAKFFFLSVDEDFVRQAVTEAGCVIDSFQVFTNCIAQGAYMDSEKIFCLRAYKK